MTTLTVSFKNCQQSMALKERIEALTSDLQGLVRTSSLQRLHVTVSEENGISTDGPDVFSCIVIGRTLNNQALRFESQASSAYDAVEDTFALLRRSVLETKRARIDRRNDWGRKTQARRFGGQR